ncbi:MAG: histidine kinase [Ferruginibacter sp.]
MQCKNIIILLFLFSCIHCLQAQDINENNFTRYTQLNGLSHSYITGIVQDSIGYIWISTFRGLNRFDGNTFKQFLHSSKYNSIPDNTIFSLQWLPDNQLSIATNDGAQIISAKTLGVKNLDIPTEDVLRYWSNGCKYVCTDDDGSYGVSTNTGFYIFSSDGKLKKRFDYYTANDIGHSWMLFGRQINKLPDGNMVQENSLGMALYDRKKNCIGGVSDYPFLKQLIPFLKKTGSRIFFLSAYELLILNNKKNSFDIMDIRSGNTASFPACFNILEEIGWQTKLNRVNDSVFTINSQKKGFYFLRINTTGRTISCNQKKYFSNYSCNIVFSDKEQRLWIGTNEGLFMQNRYQKIIGSFPVETKINHNNLIIRSLYVTPDKIFAGTDNNKIVILNKQTKNIIGQFFFDSINRYNPIRCFMIVHPDTIWAGTGSGLKWFHTKNFSSGTIIAPGFLYQNTEIRLLFRDKQNNIWIATNDINHIILYKQNSHTFNMLAGKQHPLLKINMPNSFAEDKKGNIWIGGDAIARLIPQKQQVDTLIEHLQTQQNRKKGFEVMSDDEGEIWVMLNDDGIAKITGVEIPLHIKFENLFFDYSVPTSPALFQDRIFVAALHNVGYINLYNQKSIAFSLADGLPEQPVTSYFFSYDSSDRSVWYACNNIICRFPYSANSIYTTPPLLNVSEVSVINDTLINYPPQVISFKHNQNDINISLSAINFRDPQNMRFAYLIKNKKDTDWIETGTQQNILLTNISPGKYDFEIRVRAFDNKWPEQIKTLQIIIYPPFFFLKWRINNVRKAEREKLQVQKLKADEYKNRLELEHISNYFSSSLAGKKNTEEVLWDVAKNLIAHISYVDCMIYLWNNDKTKMVQKAGYGPKGSPEAIAGQVFEVVPGQGIVGYVAHTKEPVLIADTRKDPRYRVDEMVRLSEICVPIIHNGELLGVIDSEHHELNYFKERDLKILNTIATLTGDKIKQIEADQSLETKQEEIATINEQLAEAQLSALQTQMNPHFIFNALNSIKRMILDGENQNASRYMSKFAMMIRLTLNHSKEVFVTLLETIKYLRTYLEMEQLRFDDSFTYCIKADNGLDEEDTLIPSLMIQPLVENAIWHGLMQVESGKKIMISFSKHNKKVICTIEDNGIGIIQSEKLKALNNPSHRSVGLDNIRNRIKIMNEKFNTDCSLKITDLYEEDKTKRGTLVVLSLKIINQ